MKKKLLVLCVFGVMLATAVVYAANYKITVRCNACRRTNSGTFYAESFHEAIEQAKNGLVHGFQCNNKRDIVVINAEEL